MSVRISLDVDRAVEMYRAGYSLAAIGREFGCAAKTVRGRFHEVGEPIRPMGLGVVPVDVFRARYEELHRTEGLSFCDLARRLGWTCWKTSKNGRIRRAVDGCRVARTLGLKPHWTRGCEYYRERVTLETAARLCEALELDPFEVGI
jgi:hypothetical protein